MTILRTTTQARAELDSMIAKAYKDQTLVIVGELKVSFGLRGSFITIGEKPVDYFRAAEFLRAY